MAKKRASLKRPVSRVRKLIKKRPTSKPLQATGVAFVGPVLKAGEAYAGILLNEAGKPVAHLVEIARRTADGTWQEQKAWAKSVGGELPDRQEGALLYANRRHAYEKRWHWLREEYAGNSVFAWVQHFGYGDQYGARKVTRSLACAVRRVAI